jgi:effector-binding domain-containing protein
LIETPQIVHTEPLHYAAVRRSCPVAEIGRIIQAGVKEVTVALQAQKVAPSGPWFTHHYCKPLEKFDLEICFAVSAPIQPHGEVYSAVWPAMDVARTVFHGNYAGLPGAWGELDKWMQAQDLRGGHEFWERYTVNPSSGAAPEDWRTELNWPVTG